MRLTETSILEQVERDERASYGRHRTNLALAESYGRDVAIMMTDAALIAFDESGSDIRMQARAAFRFAGRVLDAVGRAK